MEKFYISFSGETLPGADRDAAKQALISFFNFDTSVNADAFFSGDKVVLKRNLDKDGAARIYVALRKHGIVTKIEREADETAIKPITEALKPAARRPAAPEPATPKPSAPEPAAPEPAQAKAPAAGKPAAKQASAKKPAGKSSPPAKAKHGKKAAKAQASTAGKKQAAAAKPARPAAAAKAVKPGAAAKESGAAAKQPGASAQKPRQASPASRPDPRRVVKVTEAQPRESAPTAPRRKRQPGEPNLFDVRLAEGALREAEPPEDHFSHAAKIGAVIITLAFILVGVRFWLEHFETPPNGLGAVVVDAGDRPAVVVNDQLLRHDRAGNPGELADASKLGISPSTPLDFYADGRLLIQLPPAGEGVPTWLHGVLDIRAAPGRLERCTLREGSCELLLQPLAQAAFAVDRRTGKTLVADVQGNRLIQLTAEGVIDAMRALPLTAPVSLSLHDGVVYLTQGDAVIALSTDDKTFGEELGRYGLSVDGAQATGHIFPTATAWLAGHWYVRMQSRDGSEAGLYQFTEEWAYRETIMLPDNATPGNPVSWGAKLLVPDATQEVVYRVAADNSVEATFSEEAIAAAISTRREAQEFTGSLQAVILLVMFFAALVLYTFATIKTLQGKVYKAMSTTDEKSFDITDEEIVWLDPMPDARLLLKRALYVLGGTAAVLLCIALLAPLGLGTVTALLLLLAGVAGYCYAMYQSWGCHLGLKGDELIAVDHNSTYRIGRGPKIQYVSNYVMIDDVVVYLGHRLLPQFKEEPLRQNFEPVVTRGIKVDRTTLRLKLINSKHPMFYGMLGMVFAMMAAGALLLVT